MLQLRRCSWTFLQTPVSSVGLDISADLTELGRTPITVVSAGVKSILDIGRTLEYLVSNFPSVFCHLCGFISLNSRLTS